MTNEQKYKTVGERVTAFNKWCNLQDKNNTKCATCYEVRCFANWLALHYEEEKSLQCPFCGGETHINSGHLKKGVVHYWVDCISPECMYRSAHNTDRVESIAAHNRVCRAAKAAKEGDAK